MLERLHACGRGCLHAQGYSVRRKSVQRAFSYYSMAAAAGHGMAAYNAAMMYLGGRGTPK